MNRFQHAIDTKRIALNDLGIAAWVKHNHNVIMEALKWASQIDDLKAMGHTAFTMKDEPVQAFSPALDFDAEGRN